MRWGYIGSSGKVGDVLLHDLQVDLGHVDLLVELQRELGRLKQTSIYAGRHDYNCRGGVSTRSE